MLTAKLLLERLDKEGRLLEKREQRSKCFTKSFIELLYIAHAQIESGAPYTMTDIRGMDACDIDSEITALDVGNRGCKPTLAIGSPPGSSQSIFGGGHYGDNLQASMLQSILMGEHLGIQLGGGATAVTPLDHFLETRFGHGIRPADGGNVTFESYKVNDDTAWSNLNTDYWAGQSFRAQHHHKLYSVKLKLYRVGTPGIVTVDIHAGRWTDDEISPIGSALVTQTFDGDTLTVDTGGEWREITFPSQIEIVPGMDYVIVIYAAATGLRWLYDTSSSEYYRGTRIESTNGGGAWSTKNGDDFMFEEIGRSSGELHYGGCELDDLTISDPDGEFTIRRYLKNKSGESREVNEVGIYAAGHDCRGTTESGNIFVFLIAHDVLVSPITVAATELLRATYVPQITV